jgi:hypothetical protein
MTNKSSGHTRERERQGATNQEMAEILTRAGILSVEERCYYVERSVRDAPRTAAEFERFVKTTPMTPGRRRWARSCINELFFAARKLRSAKPKRSTKKRSRSKAA